MIIKEYEAKNNKEISINKGERIIIIISEDIEVEKSKLLNDFVRVKYKNKIGLIPNDIFKEIKKNTRDYYTKGEKKALFLIINCLKNYYNGKKLKNFKESNLFKKE
jgi:hypothetical protein